MSSFWEHLLLKESVILRGYPWMKYSEERTKEKALEHLPIVAQAWFSRYVEGAILWCDGHRSLPRGETDQEK